MHVYFYNWYQSSQLKILESWLDCQFYAWELPGVAGNAWNGEPGRNIAIGSSCIWDKFIFLANGRLGDYMEMLLECLRNPGRRLGIITSLQLVCGRWSTSVEVADLFLQCEGDCDCVKPVTEVLETI
eukprot:Gb_37771 [translate_table: standard]